MKTYAINYIVNSLAVVTGLLLWITVMRSGLL